MHIQNYYSNYVYLMCTPCMYVLTVQNDLNEGGDEHSSRQVSLIGNGEVRII